jgi:hypothetical protein
MNVVIIENSSSDLVKKFFIGSNYHRGKILNEKCVEKAGCYSVMVVGATLARINYVYKYIFKPITY